MKTTRAPSPLALKDAALRAARVSGRILMRRFGTKLRIDNKPNAGLVTDADLASEKAAVAILRKARPDFTVLTEEAGEIGSGRGEGRWLLDPLDGTTNYAHGFGHFCVSIAAEWEGVVVAGVVHHPISGETYWAIRGKGAFHSAKKSNQRMKVSGARALSEALLTTGFSSHKEKWLEKEIATFESISRLSQGVRRPGSAALDLALVARGVFDGFWERGLSPWDVAAGALLVEEAGGKITDIKGSALRLGGKAGGVEILASNRLLHDRLRAAVGTASSLEQSLSGIVDNVNL